MRRGFGIIISLSLLLFNIFFSTNLSADEGDTIKVQAFDYSMRGNVKEAWVVFPDENTKYEKVYMYYSLKCDPLNTPYKCGEWDYLTYTYASKKTGNYQQFPNFKVNGNTYDTFPYMLTPAWNYQTWIEKSYVINDTINLKQINSANLNSGSEKTFLQEMPFYRMQYVWKASELKQIGLDSNLIRGIHLYLGKNYGDIGRIAIRIKNTMKDSLFISDVEQDGFLSVFDKYVNISTDGWVYFAFNTSFSWDSLSNILIDFSVSKNFNLQPIHSKIETTNWPSGLVSSSADYALDFEGPDYIDVPTDNFNQIENEITVSLWQYGDPTIQAQNDHVFEAFDVNNKRVISSHLPWSNSNVYWDAGNDGGDYDRIYQTANPEDYKGQWNFWTFTKNAISGEMNIYLNAKLWHSGNGKNRKMSGITKFRIGSNGNNTSNYDGLIDEFSVWNTVLTEAQIQELMNHEVNPSASHYTSLIYYYNCNEGQGVSLSDKSQHHAQAKMDGLPQWTEHSAETQFKNFKSVNSRPIIIIDQSSYGGNYIENLQVDSTQQGLQKVIFYNDFTHPDISTDTLYVWPSYYSYTFDNLGNKIDSTLVAVDSTLIRVDHPAYYDEKYHQLERYEIGRYITPYGINLDLGEGFMWIYDISDYASLLHDSVKIASGNWQELHDLKFVMIEGTPARDPIDVINLWNASVAYTGTQEEVLVPKTIKINEDVKTARLKIRTTGHGFGGNENCAEFCAKTHNVHVDGSKRFEQFVWRDNCGSNPVYPQGGTWIYNRANWCPGAEVYTDNFEMGKYITAGDSVEIDYNFQSGYTWNGSGSRPTYRVASQIAMFGDFNFSYDVGIDNIVRPNNWEFYSRENPSCQNPKVIITNYGSETISSVLLKYGSVDTDLASFKWKGSLKSFESAEVELPFYWGDWDGDNRFRVSIANVNEQADEYARNNTAYSTFELPDVYHNELLFYFRTNNAANESSYTLTDASGQVVYERGAGTMTNNKMYIDTFYLPNTYGCYKLQIKDAEGDGLSFWANNDGDGSARIRKVGGVFYPSIEPDFGNESTLYFTTGWSLGENKTKAAAFEFNVYPNPTEGKLFVQFNLEDMESTLISVLDLFGKTIQSFELGITQADMFEVDLSNQAAGFYIIQMQNGNQVETKKVLLSK